MNITKMVTFFIIGCKMYDKIRQNSYSNIEIELCCCVYYFFFCVRSKIIHYTLKRSDKVEHIPLIFEKMISRINFVLSCKISVPKILRLFVLAMVEWKAFIILNIRNRHVYCGRKLKLKHLCLKPRKIFR